MLPRCRRDETIPVPGRRWSSSHIVGIMAHRERITMPHNFLTNLLMMSSALERYLAVIKSPPQSHYIDFTLEEILLFCGCEHWRCSNW